MAEAAKEFKTEEMTLNMGPQHPSTHGVLRFVVQTDGEIIRLATPDIGYLHRSIEKIGEIVTYPQFMPYTDRVDYVASMNSNWAYAAAVEKLAEIEIPRRAEFIRILVCELNRISSHLIGVGAMAMDIGAATPFMHGIREREWVNNLLEEICGARLTFNFIRIGGVWMDTPVGWKERVLEFVNHFEPALDEFNHLITTNEIFVKRCANVAVIPYEDAIDFGLVGPNLRGSGYQWDLRRDEPYSLYPELDFEVPIGQGDRGKLGDCYDRYMVRIHEMKESCKIIRQCFEKMEPGPVMAKMPRVLKPPVGECYMRTEAPRGEQGYYLVSDGSPKAYRVRIRTGSFSAMAMMETLSQGIFLADLIAVIGSLDVVAPEVDR